MKKKINKKKALLKIRPHINLVFRVCVGDQVKKKKLNKKNNG